MDFFGKLLKKAVFGLKTSQKAPRDSLGPPQDGENYFSDLPGYENSMKEKRIFELSTIEKKLV